MLSRRSRVPGEENRISVAVRAARAGGAALLDLTTSNPTAANLPYPDDLLAGLSQAQARHYAPDPRGLAGAREAIAQHHAAQGVHVAPERLWLTSGTSEAYGMLFKLLCDPGDEVLVPCPGYPLFEHLARLEGVRTRSYPLAYDGRWYLDLPALASRVGPRTRAVVCISPNNPTGSYLKHAELAALARLGLPLISDEVFGEFPLHPDATRVASALTCSEVPVFVLSGLSKTAGLPQVKLAWIALGGQPEAHAACAQRLDLISDCYLSASTPAQLSVGSLLAGTGPLRDAIRARMARNLATLKRLCASPSPLDVLHVEGGWYAIVRLPGTLSEECWALQLLRRAQVLVHPGYFYDLEQAGGTHAVVSLLTPEVDVTEGARRIAEVVACGDLC